MLLVLLPVLLLASTTHAQDLLTLDEAVARVLEENYTVRTARNTLEIAENNVTLGNAGFLPSLSASAGYTETISNTEQQFLGDRGTQEVDGAKTTRQNAGASLRWTAFDGLGRFATYDRLQAERTRTALQTETTIDLAVADVVIAYTDLVRLQQQLEVLRGAVEISEERLRIAEARFDLGSASELEVRQARVDLNTDRAEALRLESSLVEAKADFNRQLARPTGEAFTVAPEVDVDASLSLEALRVRAVDANPVVQQAEQRVTIAALTRREIAAERFPQLDLTLGTNYANLEAESGFLVSNRSVDLSYGLALSYDVFDGLNRRRRLQNARVEERNAALNVQDVRAQLDADLARLFASYQNSLELIALERQNLEATRLNVEVALERFRLGTITSVELREVQEQLIRAESRLLTAQFEAKRAETELRRLAGTLVPGDAG
ncbi:MAG: TolC family protein [Bacteroidetes bacterium]|nr:TolC family protein [Bacteroidota bacterium]